MSVSISGTGSATGLVITSSNIGTGAITSAGIADGTIVAGDLADGAVTPAKTSLGALPSMVRLTGANGYGSTNTKIRRFTNLLASQGTDITYADSATLGGSFTINTGGVYSISYTDSFDASTYIGLSSNTTQPTVHIAQINQSDILSVNLLIYSSGATFTSFTGYLPSGTVVRAHTGGVATYSNGSYTTTNFTIVRVA